MGVRWGGLPPPRPTPPRATAAAEFQNSPPTQPPNPNSEQSCPQYIDLSCTEKDKLRQAGEVSSVTSRWRQEHRHLLTTGPHRPGKNAKAQTVGPITNQAKDPLPTTTTVKEGRDKGRRAKFLQPNSHRRPRGKPAGRNVSFLEKPQRGGKESRSTSDPICRNLPETQRRKNRKRTPLYHAQQKTKAPGATPMRNRATQVRGIMPIAARRGKFNGGRSKKYRAPCVDAAETGPASEHLGCAGC